MLWVDWILSLYRAPCLGERAHEGRHANLALDVHRRGVGLLLGACARAEVERRRGEEREERGERREIRVVDNESDV